MEPLVSCVMIAGKHPELVPFSRAAMRSFLQQTYPNTELVIVNDGEQPILPDASADASLEDQCVLRISQNRRIKEFHFYDKRRSLGELRNLGLRLSSGSWIAQWDSDDWSHPERISYMMQHRQENHAVLLLHQIRYSFANGNSWAMRYDRPREGIPGTVLHPRVATGYADEGKHEDSHFLNKVFGERRVVLDNHPGEFPGPAFYLRFYSGLNTWDERHVMRSYAGRQRQQHWDLPRAHAEYLRHVLATHYSVAHLPLGLKERPDGTQTVPDHRSSRATGHGADEATGR